MQPLTPKEKIFYDYITNTIRTEGYSPSVRDIQQALDIKSTSTVHAYLQRLEEKGYIRKSDRKSRSLRVSDPLPSSQDMAHVPLVGTVAAGLPILATQNIERYIDIPLFSRSLRDRDLFALRVKGESMIEVGIMPGDIIVVHRDAAIRNGEIVVALIDDEATVKTFYQEDGHFRLQPENSTMEPIIVQELSILGKVVSVLRFYREG
ncbi:MAG: transcriptional repressor LexA [Clostridia bacterium]|nr:transcriptional repressor LexA [Clostridia bacterium]